MNGRMAARIVSRGIVMFALAACARASGAFVWVDQMPLVPAGDDAYMVGTGDVLNVQVWDQPQMSSRVRVRPDGRVSLPLIGDVMVAGNTIDHAVRTVETRLQESKLVVAPRVTVILEESAPISISILGSVARPGTYELQPGAGVAEALASAGGLTEFAHRDRIFVVRRTPDLLRIRFDFKAISQAEGRAALFRLKAGDVVIAE